MIIIKKDLFILSFLVAAAFSSLAQDILVLKNGTRVQVVLEEVTETEIRYRRYNQLSSALYTKKRRSVERIEYANGTVEQFNISQTQMDFMKRNLVGLNYLDLFSLNFSLVYERLLGEYQKILFYMPVRVRFAEPALPLRRDRNAFSFGAGFMFYPFGQRRTSYYTGPLVNYSIRGISRRPAYIFIRHRGTSYHNFLGGYIVSGIKSNFNDRVGMNFNLGTGFLRVQDHSDIDERFYEVPPQTRFHMIGEISVFYRF